MIDQLRQPDRGAGRGLPNGQQLRQQGKVEQKQFKRCCWFRALHYAALRVKGHLPCRVQVSGRKLRAMPCQRAASSAGRRSSAQWPDRSGAAKRGCADCPASSRWKKPISTPCCNIWPHRFAHGGCNPALQGDKQLANSSCLRGEHLPGGCNGEFLAAKGEGLIEQRHAVAHAARRPASNKPHGPFFKGRVFLAQHGGEVGKERVLRSGGETQNAGSGSQW